MTAPSVSRASLTSVLVLGASLFLFPIGHRAQAATIVIDFGNSGTSTPSGTTTWNNITSAKVGGTGSSVANLLTTTNVSSGFTLAITGDFNAVNTGGTTASTIFPTTATQDSFYGNVATSGSFPTAFPNGQLTLSNLDPLLTYDLTFYASRTAGTQNRETQYTVTGTGPSQVALLDAWNNVDTTKTIYGVSPDANNKIIIDLTAGANNNTTEKFYYIGALQVTTNAVPEPTRALLLLLGGCFVAVRRRRPASC